MSSKVEKLEKIFLKKTINYFNEKYESLKHIGQKNKKKMEQLRLKIAGYAKEQGFLRTHIIEVSKVNSLFVKASKVFPWEAVTDLLVPWVESEGEKCISQKLGFVMKLPTVNYDNRWRIDTIHPFSYGFVWHKFDDKFDIEAAHFGDLEKILIMEKEGTFYAREVILHGLLSPRLKELGEYDSLESLFDEWCFTFQSGDHPVRIEKTEPNYEVELLDSDVIKNNFRIDFNAYAESVLELDRNFEEYFKKNKKKFRLVRDVLWCTPMEAQINFESVLKEISKDEKIQKGLEGFYNQIYRITSTTNWLLKKQNNNPAYVKSLTSGYFKDLPDEAVQLIPYTLNMLTNRVLSGCYYNFSNMKDKLLSWLSYLILRPCYDAIRWYQEHTKYADELKGEITPVKETLKRRFRKIKMRNF